MSYIDEINGRSDLPTSDYKLGFACAEVDRLRQQLAEARKDHSEDQWYPVSEMLPTDGERVLMGWIDGEREIIRTGYHYEATGWRRSGNFRLKRDPHWWRNLPTIRGKSADAARKDPPAKAHGCEVGE